MDGHLRDCGMETYHDSLSTMRDAMEDEEKDIVWMFCTQCKRTVLHNNSGICLACQRIYSVEKQPDSWVNMHTCDKCGSPIVFMCEGCLECKEGVDDSSI